MKPKIDTIKAIRKGTIFATPSGARWEVVGLQQFNFTARVIGTKNAATIAYHEFESAVKEGFFSIEKVGEGESK